MALLCLSYFITISAALSTVGLLIDYALPSTAPRRWVWSSAIFVSFFLPPFLAFWNSSPVISLWGREIVRLPAIHPAMQGGLDHNLLDCSGPYGLFFNKLWIVSLAILLVWSVISYRRTSQMLSSGTYTIVEGVPVLVTGSLGPATVGIWRPRIVIPRWVLALPARQRSYIVRHEAEHLSAHDPRLLCGAAILACLAPWNLPLWFQLHRLRLAVEMDCDNRVVSALGDRDAYSELLFRVAEASSRTPFLQPAFIGSGMLERRLTALLGADSRGSISRLLAPAVGLALLLIVISVPHPMRTGAMAGHSMASHVSMTKN